jgi:RHS repeat-associated protein
MYVAEEHGIYGSSRVGVDNRKDTLFMGTAYTPTWGGMGTDTRELGEKSFELSNHLGNVLVTVSDKPVYKNSSGTIYFEAEITSITDYYPFGSCMQGRGFSSAAYRYGFNGKEKEADGTADNYDFGARIYDGRLGRWLAVDPLNRKFTSLSTYQFSNNSSLYYVDKGGKEIIIHYKEKNKETGIEENKYIKYTPGVKPDIANAFVQKVHEAYEYSKNSPTGKDIWAKMDALVDNNAEINGEVNPDYGKKVGVFLSEENWTLTNSEDNNAHIDEYIFDMETPGSEKYCSDNNLLHGGTVVWDPTTEMSAQASDGILIGYLAPSTVLVHEFDHAVFRQNDISSSNNNGNEVTGYDVQYETKEEKRVIEGTEWDYITEINEYNHSANNGKNDQPLRTSHGSRPHVKAEVINGQIQKVDDGVNNPSPMPKSD